MRCFMSDFSSVYTAIEIADMRSTIDDIQKILQTIPFDEDVARQKIYEINYFQKAKILGKSVDEMRKEWQNR